MNSAKKRGSTSSTVKKYESILADRSEQAPAQKPQSSVGMTKSFSKLQRPSHLPARKVAKLYYRKLNGRQRGTKSRGSYNWRSLQRTLAKAASRIRTPLMLKRNPILLHWTPIPLDMAVNFRWTSMQTAMDSRLL